MENKAQSGIGFVGLLQLALIVLKLCKVITWSWAVVLIPLWIDLAIVAIAIILFVVGVVLSAKKRK